MSKPSFSPLFQHVMKAAAVVSLACAASLSFAGVLTVAGDTTGGPTFHRPIANGNVAPVSLSFVGTAVHYAVTAFHVNNNASYLFVNTSSYDNFLSIYQNAFNPAAGLANGVASNDDFSGINAGFAGLNLLAGVNYFAVSSSFANASFGAFTLTITGPGNNMAILGSVNNNVPEPTSLALMGLGLAGLAALRRRRSA